MKLIFQMFVKKNDDWSSYYKISSGSDNKIWISNKDGEGGEFSCEAFHDCIDKFFKDNF